MRHISPILFTLLTTIAATACDFDPTTIGYARRDGSTCMVQLVAAQPITTGHPGWISAAATSCTVADLEDIRVDLYATLDALRYYGSAELHSFDPVSGCVIWAWPKTAPSTDGDWLALLSPVGASGSIAATASSAMILEYDPPSVLPAYASADGWHMYLPGPAGPVSCQPEFAW